MNPLQLHSEKFAETLNSTLEPAVGDRHLFGVNIVADGNVAFVGPTPFENNRPSFVPLASSISDSSKNTLLLRVEYQVETDNDGHLKVRTSTFGLFVDVRQVGKPVPVVRVEYDRDANQRRDSAAAHVHLHANSPEIAWIYGMNGKPAKDLHSLHFPVGGRRFRPTLEEFLFFLDREGLFNGWKTQTWKAQARTALIKWDHLQAKATVRRFPKDCAQALTELGYEVTPPHPT